MSEKLRPPESVSGEPRVDHEVVEGVRRGLRKTANLGDGTSLLTLARARTRILAKDLGYSALGEFTGGMGLRTATVAQCIVNDVDAGKCDCEDSVRATAEAMVKLAKP